MPSSMKSQSPEALEAEASTSNPSEAERENTTQYTLSSSRPAHLTELGMYTTIPYDQSIKPIEKPLKTAFHDFPVISTDRAIQALREYVHNHGVCKKKALQTLRVLDESIRYCYRVDIDTFYETRSVAPALEQTPIVDNMSQTNSSVWEVEFPVPELLTDYYEERVVYCGTDVNRAKCPVCHPTPSTCSIHENCVLCKGSGEVSRPIQVRCDYSTLQQTRHLNQSLLDNHLVEECPGYLVYSVKGEKIMGGNVFLDTHLNELINSLLKEADAEVEKKHARLRFQQLFVSVIPVRHMNCASGKAHYGVTVYDYDKKVLSPDFPRYPSELIGKLLCNF